MRYDNEVPSPIATWVITMNMANAAAHSGRILLALYFFLPGVMKFMDWDRHVQLMETHGMLFVPYLLGLAGVIQIVASLSLFINRHVAICALTLAAMTLVINVNLHDFWNIYEGVDVKHETQNFVKNLAIFAGLLLLAATAMQTPAEENSH